LRKAKGLTQEFIQWDSGFARAGTRIGELLKDLSNGTVASPEQAQE